MAAIGARSDKAVDHAPPVTLVLPAQPPPPIPSVRPFQLPCTVLKFQGGSTAEPVTPPSVVFSGRPT